MEGEGEGLGFFLEKLLIEFWENKEIWDLGSFLVVLVNFILVICWGVERLMDINGIGLWIGLEVGGIEGIEGVGGIDIEEEVEGIEGVDGVGGVGVIEGVGVGGWEFLVGGWWILLVWGIVFYVLI